VSSSSGLSVRGLSTSWTGRRVLDQVSFDLASGEYATLMGPNGAGKSTLLRVIAGFDRPDEGRVCLAAQDLAGVPPHRRQVGLLFQEPTLLPRRTVWENVAYGPQIQGRTDREVDASVAEMLALLRLTALSERDSEELSGGERQRVALARSLAARPRLLLLDEPLAAVDPELRATLRAEFRRAIRSLGVTALHVTHDREEGLFLGDRVLLLLDGRLAQSGRPEEVFAAPRTDSVARFLGYNLFRRDGRMWAVHPTEVTLGAAADGTPARVLASGAVGDRNLVVLETEDGLRWEVRTPGGAPRPPEGGQVGLRWGRAVPVEGSPAPGSPGPPRRQA
jgi:ABC-type Fe3+/spermidine/putrescine transport system ATPase subunit